MKRKLNIIGILGLTFLLGCGSFESLGSKLLSSSALTVDATMKGWASYVVAGRSSPDEETKVKQAYQQYQASMAIAQNAYVLGVSTTNRQPFTVASQVLLSNQQALIQLVSSFQVRH